MLGARRGAVEPITITLIVVGVAVAIPLIHHFWHKQGKAPLELDRVLEEDVRSDGMEALRPVRGPFHANWVLKADGSLLKSCWTSDTLTSRSISNRTISSVDTSSAGVSAAAGVLGQAGVQVAGGSQKIRQVQLALTGLAVESADMLRFAWDSGGCLQDLESAAHPVTTEVKTFGSMLASVTTDNGVFIRIDSASLTRSDINVTAGGNANWKMTSSGSINAAGDSLAYGYRYSWVGLKRFTCPDTALSVALGVVQVIGDCQRPGVWYRIAVDTMPNNAIRAIYQGSTATKMDTVTGTRGFGLALSKLPRRLDRLVVTQTPSGFSMVIERTDVVAVPDPKQGIQPLVVGRGSREQPLSDSVAATPLKVRRR